MKIAVGLSGGVDSSVAAFLLKQQGHEIFGAIMKIWPGGTCASAGKGNACFGPDEPHDIEDAQKVCNHLGIPLHIIDCVDKYQQVVIDYFKNEYKAGRTPNPCVVCNQAIKFGVLPELIKKDGAAFDKFATGHYADIEYDSEHQVIYLRKAADAEKDQTYFLYRLTQDQLSSTIFPLGKLTKKEVRRIAKEAQLPVHAKEESQDFYSGNYSELMGKESKPGNIVDMAGKVMGKHEGIWNYTIGQRKGLGIAAGKPIYVVAINQNRNEVIVGDQSNLFSKGLSGRDITGFHQIKSGSGKVKIRSTSHEVPCNFEIQNDTLKVIFEQPQLSVTPGQSAVIYKDGVVLGGGVIDKEIK